MLEYGVGRIGELRLIVGERTLGGSIAAQLYVAGHHAVEGSLAHLLVSGVLGGKLEQGEGFAVTAIVHHLHGTGEALARQLVSHILVGGVALVEAAQQI